MTCFPKVVALTFAVLAASMSPAALARESSDASWIKDEISVDGSAQIYLSPVFSTINGRFKAVPESIIDTKDAIEGDFLLGEYRYLFKKPTTGKNGKLSDELVSTEVLDCKDNFFGTMKQVRKYKGTIVNSSASASADVTMIQTSSPNIGAKLCALYQNKKVARLQQKAVTNPSYNPRPSKQDIDHIIDKYDAAGARNTK